MARKRIGELLVEQGVITAQILDQALAVQKDSKQRLGAVLVSRGAITEEQLALVLSQALNITTIDLARAAPEWAAIHMLRGRFCELNELFPVALERRPTGEAQDPRARKLLVAMSDPLNTPAIQEIEFTTGLTVSVRLATGAAIRAAISRYYLKQAGSTAAATAPTGRPGAVRVVSQPPEPQTGQQAVVVGEEIVSADHELPGFDQLIEKNRKEFWALIRVLSKKGLISREEFAAELLDGEG